MTDETPPSNGTVTVPRRSAIIAATLVSGLVIGCAGVAAGSLATAEPAVATTALEPVNTARPNAFLPRGAGVDGTQARQPEGAAGPVDGDTPGLFGRDEGTSCDRVAIVRGLDADPDRRTAWAKAAGVGDGDIARFLSQLTPVVLRADTAVTDYGYENGGVTSYPAVLQAGTAVLVDGYGTPRVKCHSGNPLAAPPTAIPSVYAGPAWPTFRDVAVVAVRPAPAVINNLTLVDVRNETVVTTIVAARFTFERPRAETPYEPETAVDPSEQDGRRTSYVRAPDPLSDPSTRGGSGSSGSHPVPERSTDSATPPDAPAVTTTPDPSQPPRTITPEASEPIGELPGSPMPDEAPQMPDIEVPELSVPDPTTTTTPRTTTPRTSTPKIKPNPKPKKVPGVLTLPGRGRR